ncbi:hypothetical protein CERZMDRAFT_41699 [Cercospora zeae-maydis SCOH1-5]|uniref:Integral membrane protein n=1 Tax=Cercospora zeae-maydis SCOH1-5 TaxID=717836 RepID=A0A6A6FG66_9PEZI|nr:hypothetical protein CERZMDRAFT_41699 [Cercospora zeae-maydis SCOH1-5]
MGKAARAACIFVPMALTIAAFVCGVLLQVAGWNTLGSYYFFRANLTDLNVQGTEGGGNSVLNDAIGQIRTSGGIGKIYNVYLWNYCYSNETDGSHEDCTGRKTSFVFDPIKEWENYDQYSEQLLGDSGKSALNAYRHVAKWMFIAYQVAFWTNLAVIVIGIFALFSRIGSLFTWILSIVSTFFTFASVVTSTALFTVLVSSLNEVLEPYGINLTLGRQALTVAWLGVAFSLGATIFWLFSICCCSGKSNPHHKTNKGGLLEAEPKGMGYGVEEGRGRGGLKAEKTGDYQRVESPYMGANDHDQVPLHQYGQLNPYAAAPQTGYEPYRHS